MNSFLDNFQPFVVKFSHDICIPASCRGKYMLCVNAMGIKWFEENFITLEYGDGLLEGEVLGPKYLMLEDSDSNKFDIPRLYIPITKDIVNDTGEFSKFLIKSLTDNSVFGEGIEGFRPSKEYYVNETLYKWCRRDTDHVGKSIQAIIKSDDDIYLPDYLYYDRENDVPKPSLNYFEELTKDEKRIKDLQIFFNKNEISELKFTENDFKFLPQTFFKIILKYTDIHEEEKSVSPNNIYEAVQNYFANFKADEATRLIQTILNTKVKSNSDLNPTVNNYCNSCNNQYALTGTNYTIEKSCFEKYKDAMDEWLKIMLGDLSYYNSWMTISEDDCKYPNFDLIDLLIELLNEYLKYGKFPYIEETRKNNCSCSSLDSSYSSNECIKNNILNYIKVLEWVKQCETVKNKNKIKAYGKEFAGFIIKYFN